MKLCFFAVLLLGAAAQVYSQTCHLREVDLCLAIGMFHYQSNGIPADEEKVDEWCETMKEVTECMGNFTEKCMSPVQKDVMNLLSGSDDVGKQFCQSGSEVRASYLGHADCLAEGAEGDEFKTQMKDIQAMIEKLFDVPFKSRFPLMCCGFRRFRTSTEKMTAKRCGEDSVSMLNNIIKMIVTDLPEMICQRYDPESAECKGLLPPSGTPPKGAENQSQLGKLMDTVFGNL